MFVVSSASCKKRKEKKKTPERLKAQGPSDKTNSADTLHLLTISLAQPSAPLSIWEVGVTVGGVVTMVTVVANQLA